MNSLYVYNIYAINGVSNLKSLLQYMVDFTLLYLLCCNIKMSHTPY